MRPTDNSCHRSRPPCPALPSLQLTALPCLHAHTHLEDVGAPGAVRLAEHLPLPGQRQPVQELLRHALAVMSLAPTSRHVKNVAGAA